MEPKTFGPLFTYIIRYAQGTILPRLDRTGWTREVEEPFRYGVSWLLRLPGGRALVVGRWRGRYAEEEHALEGAIFGRPLHTEAEEIRRWG